MQRLIEGFGVTFYVVSFAGTVAVLIILALAGGMVSALASPEGPA